MESFVTARCFQLLKIKNGLFRREALYLTGRSDRYSPDLECSYFSALAAYLVSLRSLTSLAL